MQIIFVATKIELYVANMTANTIFAVQQPIYA